MLIILSISFFIALPISLGQEQLTPTPVGIIAIQGGDNMGRVQLLTIPDIIDRTGIRAWQDAGWTGYGIRVGILDQAFGDFLSFEATSGKSVSVIPGADKNSLSADTVTHGTDVLAIINAIAPGAELYACRYTTFDQYVGCIDWFITSGVKIINHSVGVPALPLDGTNIWAREVDRAARSGILWVNAAGNFAGGYISDFFTDTNLNSYHEFRGSGITESLGVNPISSAYGRVMLSWEGNDQYAANEIDFDLEVIDFGENIIAESRQPQTGNPGEIALEWTQVQMSQPFGVRVRNVDGRGEQVHFVLFVEFASLPGGIGRESIIAPGDSLSALTVGGLQGYQVAPYSSRGPLSSGVIKPDLVAQAEIMLPNGRLFVGTSASAPVASGVAALVWEANRTWIYDQLFGYLRESAQDDSEFPGQDANYGMGRLYLFAPEIILTPAPATPMPIATNGSTNMSTPAVETSSSPTATLSPTATSTLTVTLNASEVKPCTIHTEQANVDVRVGPGAERGVFISLPVDQDFRVIGKAEAQDGSLWWEIDKDSIQGGAQANSLWVAQENVTTVGDCNLVPESVTPPVVFDASPDMISSGVSLPVTFQGYASFLEENTNHYFSVTTSTTAVFSINLDPPTDAGCGIYWAIIHNTGAGWFSVAQGYFHNGSTYSQSVTLSSGEYVFRASGAQYPEAEPFCPPGHLYTAKIQ
ncbi:MAG: S8 family serine peptidase [Anaerolineales bacterium]|nr:S8 family serine peptidase [Anaerolineales bacterium]